MSNETESPLNADQIEEVMIAKSSKENEEKAEENCVEPKQNKNTEKRAYLEVNNIEKYKQFVLKPLETKRFKASETLSKVRDFLPLFKQTTDKLLNDFKENPDGVNIENVDEEDEHIEMNLALVAQSDSDSDDLDDSDEDEENSDEESSSSNNNDTSINSLNDLNLGFDVKDPNKLTGLKLTKSSKSKSKQLIKMIDSDQEQEVDKSKNEIENDPNSV